MEINGKHLRHMLKGRFEGKRGVGLEIGSDRIYHKLTKILYGDRCLEKQ